MEQWCGVIFGVWIKKYCLKPFFDDGVELAEKVEKCKIFTKKLAVFF